MAGERILPLAEMAGEPAPYFSHGAGAGPAAGAMSGRLCDRRARPGRCRDADAAGCRRAGAGHRSGRLRPLSRRACRRGPGQTRHASDNREELERARLALALAARGGAVAVVSSGDAGVFAMASAVFEAIEHGDPAWRALDVEVMPGISAMFAAAARIGAPLGHDFCAISLSDNLKPWAGGDAAADARRPRPASSSRSTTRCRARARGSLAPRSTCCGRSCRPPRRWCSPPPSAGRRSASTFCRSAAADPARADMRTLVLIGSAATRQHRAAGRAPVGSIRRARRGGVTSCSHASASADGCDGLGPSRRRWARDHDHRHARARGRRRVWRPSPCRRNSSSRPASRCARPAADAVRRPRANGPRAVMTVGVRRHRFGRRRIDAAQHVMVPWAPREWRQILPADGQQHAARRGARAPRRRPPWSATSVQRSPATGCQAGRRDHEQRRAGRRAPRLRRWRRCCAANGCVASTSASMRWSAR